MQNQRIAMVVVALVMTLALYLNGRQNGLKPDQAAILPTSASEVFVEISGDVAHPGTYDVSANKMAIYAINLANPFCDVQSQKTHIQLSTPLQSGDAVFLSCESPESTLFVSTNAIKASQRLTLGIPFDINRVTEADLQLLPGVGPALAHTIAKYRQTNGDFGSIDELLLVEGIGEKKFQNLSHYINPLIIKNKTE